MAEDQTVSYRRLFGRFATGVAVILSEQDETLAGMTVNSLTSASLDPLLLLFCIRNESKSGEAILRAGRFTANVLTARQENIARHFAGRRDSGLEHLLVRKDGFVWIDGSNAVFRCALEMVHPGGDHKIVLGRVIDMLGPEGCEHMLVYQQGRYAHLEPQIDRITPKEREPS